MYLKFKLWNFVFIVFFLILSCTDKSRLGKGLTKEEKQFVSRFQKQLLIKIANRSLAIENVKVESEDDIEAIESPRVRPVIYDRFISTGHMELDHKKTLFISQILPQILIARFYIHQQKEMLDIVLHDKKIEQLNFRNQKAFIE